MKVALLAPIQESVPPKKYGSVELLVFLLAKVLSSKGHKVDVYASGDSKKNLSYNLIPISKTSLDTKVNHLRNIKEAENLALQKTIKILSNNSYNIIHNHQGAKLLSLKNNFGKTPVLTTLHMPLTEEFGSSIYELNKHLPYVSISNHQRKDLPGLNYFATIYNGVNLEQFPPNSYLRNEQSPMLFLARLDPQKGAINAALIALRLKRKLEVAAKVQDEDKPYFDEFSQLIDGKLVKFLGELNLKEKLKHLEKARCLIAPINWEEPFGLMFIEAMAASTPVITFARGASPEIVKDGVTGLLINSTKDDIRGSWVIKKAGLEGMAQAVDYIYSMPEDQFTKMCQDARCHVKENFSAEKMGEEYEKVYKKLCGH